MDKWFKDISQIKVFLAGNKFDIERTVSNESAVAYAKSIELEYFEKSAKTGEGIENMFLIIAEQLYEIKTLLIDSEEKYVKLRSQKREVKKCNS